MLIAKEKKQNNIAEYILYMWQIEDLIRANNLDIKKIEVSIINQYNQTEETKNEIRKWYDNLIQMMILEKISTKGHLQFIKNIIFDLFDLHLFLLNSPKEMKYQHAYTRALPYIHEYKNKLNDNEENEIGICFHALYAWLLLKLQKKEISTATQEAFHVFSQLIALLAVRYHEREKEDMQ